MEKPSGIPIMTPDFKKRIKAFLESIGASPPENEVMKHPTLTQEKVVDGKTEQVPVEFIPISYVESKLDYYFDGLWETFNFNFVVTGDKICGSLELAIWHPEAQVWIRRSGGGSVFQQVMPEEGPVEAAAGDVGYLKTECVKNAAKSLGGMFGRGLNRNNEANYVTVMLTAEDVEREIRDIQTLPELQLYTDTLPDNTFHDKRVKNVMNEKRLSIKGKMINTETKTA